MDNHKLYDSTVNIIPELVKFTKLITILKFIRLDHWKLIEENIQL